MTGFNNWSPADQVAELLTVIYNKGLTTSSGGNISIKDDQGNIYISPASLDKGRIKGSDICRIDTNGLIKGVNIPSSELEFHKSIYKIRNDIYCIIHAHPADLVNFSLKKRTPNINLFSNSFTDLEEIGFAEYSLPGSQELSQNLCLQFSKGLNSVIMENHGAITIGCKPLEALGRFEFLECMAEAELIAARIKLDNNSYVYLKSDDSAAIFNKQNKITYEDENEIGEKLCCYLKRAYMRSFVNSQYSSFSARINHKEFYLNNSQTPLWLHNVKDLQRLTISQKKKYPHSFKELHSSIYSENPEIGSIIISSPSHLISFMIMNQIPEMRTIPETWIFCNNYDYIFNNNKADLFKEIIKSSGKYSLIYTEKMFVISTGMNSFEAFNRVEVAEYNAKSIIPGNYSEDLQLLTEDQLRELNRKYFKK